MTTVPLFTVLPLNYFMVNTLPPIPPPTPKSYQVPDPDFKEFLDKHAILKGPKHDQIVC